MLCCDRRKVSAAAGAGLIFEVLPTPRRCRHYCPWCGRSFQEGASYIISSGRLSQHGLPVVIIDLDEGEVA
jgi:hypothetical protein